MYMYFLQEPFETSAARQYIGRVVGEVPGHDYSCHYPNCSHSVGTVMMKMRRCRRMVLSNTAQDKDP